MLTRSESARRPRASAISKSGASLRIGLYAPTYPGLTGAGGIGTYVRHLAQALCSLGHAAHVLTPNLATPCAADGSVQVHSCPSGTIRGVNRLFPGFSDCLALYRRLRLLARHQQLDLVELPNWEGQGIWFARHRRVPLVVRLSTSTLESLQIDGLPVSRAARWDVRRERSLCLAADALVTHSQAHRRTMALELGIDADRITVIPLGIPVGPAPLRPAPSAKAPTVLYLGRLERRKGTLDLLAAIPEILKEAPEARFLFVGRDRAHCPGGRTHADYVCQEMAPSVRSQITFVGELPDAEVDSLLRTADLFVAPSLYESFGLVFLEAMRAGTPVVGSTVGGIPEIVVDGQSGVLVPPSDREALARAVSGLLRNPERRLALGAAGRRRCEMEFAIGRTAQRTAALYAEILGTHP